MTTLIIGASGLVGSQLKVALEDRGRVVVGTYHQNQAAGLIQVDITKPNSLKNLIKRYDPEIVYFPAASCNVELCERSPEETRPINIGGVVNLLDALENSSSHVVYYSSDYVFDGRSGPYHETELTSPVNTYGHQKVEVERLLTNRRPNRSLIIRTTVIFGWDYQEKNFVARLIRNLRDGKTMRVPKDQVGNPTYAPNLAEISVELADMRQCGIINVVGSKHLSRYEFALLAAQIFDLDSRLIVPISTDDLGQIAARPLTAGLITEKVSQLCQTQIMSAYDGLMALKEEEWKHISCQS